MKTDRKSYLEAGQVLGHYQLICPLDQGRATEVWQALHMHLQVPVALKILTHSLPEEDYQRCEQRLREEARVLAGLHHPHIVGYRDYVRGRTFLALVMEYAPGGSIARRYSHGHKLSLSLLRLYTCQVAQALYSIHERGLVHRDVKPGNILLLGPHHSLLADFGLAIYTTSVGYARKLYKGGTSAYMAPEQFHGYPSPASDQYSLAVCAYEWLTGHRPFSGDITRMTRQRKHLNLVSVRARRPELPEGVNDILRTALHTDPERRYPTVLDFARDFVEITRTARAPLAVRMPYDRGMRFPSIATKRENLPSTLPRPLEADASPFLCLPLSMN